ncbi:MAG TPA: glycosyltransferase family 9 protein [Verrucomicrobiae bacterium]|nr:glycosyltransferase family 9 protein [Verrucomicrobiae bacterium]
MENILLIRLKSIGDVIFTLPAVAAVRDNFPAAKITFLSSKENAPLLRGFRGVDTVVTLDRAASHSPLRAAPEVFRLLQRLRAGRFSLTVDFQGFGETAWLSWWSGASQRWGHVYGPGREWLYTRGIQRNKHIHHADGYLSLLRQCGLRMGEIHNDFDLPEDAAAEARDFFVGNNLDPGKPTLFLQPFTSTPFKNWPLEKYLELARHFQSWAVQIIFGGGPSERGKLEPARTAGFTVSAGVPLLVSAGLTRFSDLIVGGDTGLLHLAVAMKKRVMMLMRPGQTHPFQHPDWILAPLPGKAIAEIETRAVIAACEQALVESSATK